jgi:hypothetical protein
MFWSLVLASGAAHAQTTVTDREILDADRPEAWAMNYMAASTLMTSFGASPELAPGHWGLALELGSIPRLSAAQRAVGFNGDKTEDLNRSPVFGRLRLSLGLPAGWVAELGYTPPVTIDGTRPQGLFSVALGRRFIERATWSMSMRAFGQHGSVTGDITCPAELAGVSDSELNPYGCQAPSRDRVTLNYYGVDLTAAGGRRDWHWHGGLGLVRTELAVQLDALTISFRDRTYLGASGHLPYAVAGLAHDLGPRWRLGTELLYVPLTVRRDPAGAAGNDALTSVRLQISYHGD